MLIQDTFAILIIFSFYLYNDYAFFIRTSKFCVEVAVINFLRIFSLNYSKSVLNL